MKHLRCSQFFSLTISLTLLISPLSLSADGISVYLGKEASDIAHVIAEISQFDDNKESIIWGLRNHIEKGFTEADHDAVAETLAYAESVLAQQGNQISQDKLDKINDALDVLDRQLRNGDLAVNRFCQEASNDNDCFQLTCCKGPRGPRGHRGHRGNTGATGATGAPGSLIAGQNEGLGTGSVFDTISSNTIFFRTLSVADIYMSIITDIGTETIDVSTNATNLNIPNTIVARDGTGSFAAQEISMHDGIASGNLILSTEPSTAIAGNVIKGSSRFIHDFGTNNLFVGIDAGNFTTSGTGQNSGFGTNALTAITTGTGNTAIGYNTLPATTTGSNNTAVGDALSANVTGSNNTAIGANTLNANTTGTDNTAVGFNALAVNTDFQVTAVGSGALQNYVLGDPSPGQNVAVGYNALHANISGSNSTAIGWSALASDVADSNNTAVGSSALMNNMLGNDNTAVGSNALLTNTIGFDNTAVGNQALSLNTTGRVNTAIGASSLINNITGYENTAVGVSSLFENTTGLTNTAIGAFSMETNITGSSNTGVGHSSLHNCITGSSNVGVGIDAWASGDNNVIVGANAGNDGDNNVGVGFQTLLANEADNNVAVGYSSMSNFPLTGGNNTAVGYQAMLFNTSGVSNVAVGANALATNLTGIDNTAVGNNALTTALGNSNIAIGNGAGSGSTLTTSDNNIYIANTGANESGIIRIGTFGTQTECFVQGIHGVTTGLAAIGVLVDGNGQLGTISSTRRVKHDIKDMDADSAHIHKLRPVTFAYNHDASETKQYGLIAEEVDEVFPGLVAYGEDGQPFTVQYHVLPVLLLNEVQKQQTAIQQQQTAIQQQQTAIQQQHITSENMNAALTRLQEQIKHFVERITVLEARA